MLVIFEGCDGVGKTTYRDKVTAILSKTRAVESVGLPSNTYLGLKIREALFDPRFGTKKMVKGVNTALFMADFIQTQADLIMPALKEGKVVLCDRWFFSEYAYGFTKKDTLNVYEDIWRAYQKCEVVQPTFIFFLTANNDVIRARLERRAKFDNKQAGKIWGDPETQIRVQERYLEFFEFKAYTNVKIYDTSYDHTMSLAEEMAQLIVDRGA